MDYKVLNDEADGKNDDKRKSDGSSGSITRITHVGTIIKHWNKSYLLLRVISIGIYPEERLLRTEEWHNEWQATKELSYARKHMRAVLQMIGLVCLAMLFCFHTSSAGEAPNIVIIFADDLGYGDIGSQGARGYSTPNLDRLAREGRRFSNFYTAQPVCSASRAALLTGCYPNRIGIHGALGPNSRVGIHSNEVTLAELFKEKGYATAIFGKWHLGDHPEFLPTRHGFDEFYGLPYSNDMWPPHPEARKGTYPPMPLIEGDKTIELNPDQSRLTTVYTERAARFIRRSREKPFFVYLAHSMPHVPLHVSEKFRGKSARGLYGDVLMEIDWSVGQVLEVLKEEGLEQNTLVIFTSDNGPWLSYGDHAGSPGGLREGKGTVWEGGVRVPCLMRWPGKIPAGTVCDDPMMTIDLLPTFGRLIHSDVPRGVDGKDVWPLINGEAGARNPHEAYFFYYHVNELQAVRSGRWKLIAPHEYRTLGGRNGGSNGIPAKYEQRKTDWALFDLESDPGEGRDLSKEKPEIVSKLQALLEKARQDTGDSLTGRAGTNLRHSGKISY